MLGKIPYLHVLSKENYAAGKNERKMKKKSVLDRRTAKR
jgi:hypothetical protein